MLLLDASELMDNPGKVMREVAEFVHLDPSINESHFYFDEEKGFYCMRPPEESERGSFCLANDKGRSKNAQVELILENIKNADWQLNRIYYKALYAFSNMKNSISCTLTLNRLI